MPDDTKTSQKNGVLKVLAKLVPHLICWGIVIYLLWDVRNYVRMSMDHQHSMVDQDTKTAAQPGKTESFRNSPYQNFSGPLEGWSSELKWNI